MEKQEGYKYRIDEKDVLVTMRVINIIKDGKLFLEKISSPIEKIDERSIIITNAIKSVEPAPSPTLRSVGLESVITYKREIEAEIIVAVEEITRVFENGVEIGKKSTNRTLYYPGRDTSKCDPVSKAIIQAIHTPEVIAIYKANEVESYLKHKL